MAVGSKTPGAAVGRRPMQGGMSTPYEQPLKYHTKAPRQVASAGRQTFMNQSLTKPGSGTSADGTTHRTPGNRIN